MAVDFTPSSFLCTRFFRRASRKALSWDLWPAGAALYAPSTPAFTRECFLFSNSFQWNRARSLMGHVKILVNTHLSPGPPQHESHSQRRLTHYKHRVLHRTVWSRRAQDLYHYGPVYCLCTSGLLVKDSRAQSIEVSRNLLWKLQIENWSRWWWLVVLRNEWNFMSE